MIKRERTLRSDLISRVALVSLTAGVLAGCSAATERFGEAPIYTGGTNNQRSILANGEQQPTYKDIVNGPGGTAAGLPPASSQPLTTGSIPDSSSRVPVAAAPLPAVAKAPTYTPPVYKAPTYQTPTYQEPTYQAPAVSAPIVTAPAPEVAANAPTTWRGWSSVGGTRIPVRSGDTVTSLSRRYGVPVKAIVAVNGIEDPAQVRPGQTIVIPTYVYSDRNGSSSAPTADDKPIKPTKITRLPQRAPKRDLPDDQIVTGAVRPTQTITASAPSPHRKPFRQPSFAEVKSGTVANDAAPIRISAAPRSKPSVVHTGSVSAPAQVSSVSGNVPMPVAMPGRTANTPSAAVVSTTPAVVQKDVKPTAPIQRPQVVASVDPVVESGPNFRWPVRGRIISEFGTKPGGARNDGVNLAVPEGTPVKAADAGTVIYSGNELKGYGNLVLLRHQDGWVSAYAHNSKLNVKRGDSVSRGEVIGLAGASGSVSQPQVHFELRRGNKPVDPMRYMPKT
ncbi:peptidoglycan DD-metalloendopeptidase family protein [Labrenzia sp. CE80]|uniref:peptidoglycan DD-metalloendopeptidase family protein n=1 Tax=Labrenzia sp. CE80 TaxID=1788986 RepID=UPI00129AE11B|nr:peptidoglycan DD-metalloendopeptidase family protein [Labrenzia sp. CE80]